MIRDAVPEDAEFFVETGKEYLKTTGDNKFLTFNRDSYLEFFNRMIEEDFGKILVREKNGNLVGYCCMLLIPSMFDASQLTAQVFAVWGKGSLGLVRACEKFAREQGAVVIFAGGHPRLRQKSIGKAYSKMGYKLSDQLHMKVL